MQKSSFFRDIEKRSHFYRFKANKNVRDRKLFFTVEMSNSRDKRELFRDGILIRWSGEDLPDDFVVKLLSLSPLSDALQAEDMIAIGQDAKSLITSGLFHDHLKANATEFVL